MNIKKKSSGFLFPFFLLLTHHVNNFYSPLIKTPKLLLFYLKVAILAWGEWVTNTVKLSLHCTNFVPILQHLVYETVGCSIITWILFLVASWQLAGLFSSTLAELHLKCSSFIFYSFLTIFFRLDCTDAPWCTNSWIPAPKCHTPLFWKVSHQAEGERQTQTTGSRATVRHWQCREVQTDR